MIRLGVSKCKFGMSGVEEENAVEFGGLAEAVYQLPR